MKKRFTLFLTSAIFSFAFCQTIPNQEPNKTTNGKKEGAWVIWYNAKWKATNIKDSVAFYRKLNFIENKPKGIVNDFYKSGKKQWEGQLLSFDPEINEGIATWYFENGNKSSESFYKNGLKEGKEIRYYESGGKNANYFYINGNLNGKVETFFESGEKKVIGYYLNNERSGKWEWYKKDGTIDEIKDYDLPKPLAIKENSIFDKLYNSTYQEFADLIKNEKLNLNEKDENNATLLMHSVMYKDLDFVKLLIANGAKTENNLNKGLLCIDENCTGYYGNLTTIAAGENKLAILKYLIEELKIPIDDREFNNKTNENGWNALQTASYNGNINIIEYLIANGANINAQDKNGNTPLILACLNKQKDAAELLISLKADLTIINKAKNSFKDFAKNIVVYNYDFNPFQVYFDPNFEMFEPNCFDKEDFDNIKDLFENKLLNVTAKNKKALINKEALNEINSLFRKNIELDKWPELKCLNLNKVEKNKFPGLYKQFVIPVEFMQKSFGIVYLILNSRSMTQAGDSEKQSWFNLLPMMTDDQIFNLYSILISENNQLNVIEKKYESKKSEIKLKYLFKWVSSGYIKGQTATSNIDDFYDIQINNLKSLNNNLINFYNEKVELTANDNYDQRNNETNNYLKKEIISKSSTEKYELNKLYNLILTINQSSLNKDKLLTVDDPDYFQKSQSMLFFELNNTEVMYNLRNRNFNMSWVSDKKTVFNIKDFCKIPSNVSTNLFNTDQKTQSAYFLDKVKDSESLLKSNESKLIEWISLKEKVNNLTLNKLLENRVSSIKYYTLDDIKRNLSKSEVAIEFMVLTDKISKNEEYYALIQLPNEDIVKAIKLCNKKDLDLVYDPQSMVATYKNSKLYDLIWNPIEDIIKDYSTIYYTTDGFLNKINLGLLKQDNSYLFQSKKMIRLTSTSKLIEEKEELTDNYSINNISLFGGIDFKNLKKESRDIGIEIGDFGSIEGTKKEIKSIATIMEEKNVQTFSNENATKNTFIDFQNTKPDVIHFATHGFYIPKQERNATIGLEVIACGNRFFIIAPSKIDDRTEYEKYIGAEILEIKDINNKILDFKTNSVESFYASLTGNSNDILYVKIKKADQSEVIITVERMVTDNYKPSQSINKYAASEDPMIRAGLALYGANDKLNDDGIITAHEISRLNLPTTKLVVLSACNTAIGDNINSEGVYGLIRAFKMAGVKNLLITYWSIPDEQTVLFMQYFYNNLKTGKSPREALNYARTKMIEDGYLISTWGAFDIIR